MFPIVARVSLALALSLALLGGCKDDHGHDHDHDHKPGDATDKKAGGHDHHGHAHHGHAHGTGGQNPDAGIPHHDLGKKTIGGIEVLATQLGVAEAGGPASFEVTLPKNTADPKAIRVWVGTADGNGSQKVAAAKKEGYYQADLQLPPALPPQSKLWVEIESAAGTNNASFDLKR